jgi:hypothetical protein
MIPDKALVRKSIIPSLIPLTVGLGIFLTWWFGKAVLLKNFRGLEAFGLFWIFFSVPVGVAGLINAILYLAKNYRSALWQGLVALVCVFINIPVLVWIIGKQQDIENRAYIRIYNRSNSDIEELTIQNSLFSVSFRSLDKGESKITYIYPHYLNGEFDSSPDIDPVELIVKINGNGKKMSVPNIYKGYGVNLEVTNEFVAKIRE